MNAERSTFRYVVGIVALVGGVASVVGLYFFAVPESNKEALLLAIGIVLGWGSTVVNGEWGSSPAGRAAAAQAVNSPTKTEIVNTTADPVNTKEMPRPTFGDKV